MKSDNLFKALGTFLEALREYIPQVITHYHPRQNWEDLFEEKLNPSARNTWNRNILNIDEGKANQCIDYQCLTDFASGFFEEMKKEFNGKAKEANRFKSALIELRDTRNACNHFQQVDEDTQERAFSNMKQVAKLLENQDLYDEIVIQQSLAFGLHRDSTSNRTGITSQTPANRVNNSNIDDNAIVDNDGPLMAWFNNAIPQYDIRNGMLDESVFAANLSEVASGTGPEVYTNASLFFQKTYITVGLRNIANRVVQALNGEDTQNRVMSLQTGFGGGKTHTLISLYHIVKTGKNIMNMEGVSNLLNEGVMPNFTNAKIAVFTNNTTDVSQGHVVEDDITIKTIWGEIAYQLGGLNAYNIIRQNDIEMIAPSAPLLKQIIGNNVPCMILIDELADYCQKATAKKVGQGSLFNQTNSFIQTLTEVISSTPKSILIVTLPASATEVSSSQVGQEVLSSLETRVVRVGTNIKPVDDEEIFEVVRRRLFEGIRDNLALEKVVRRYQKMYDNRRNDLPPQCSSVSYANKIRKSYPFHPELIDMFRLRWGNDPRFQRTRGVLRLLASIVNDLWRRRTLLTGTQALIQTSDVNLEGLPALTGQITALMGSQWETVMHADVFGTSSNAYKLDDADANGPCGQYRLTQGIATTLMLASVGSMSGQSTGLSIAEIKLCMLKPQAFNHNDINGALDKFEGVAHYLYKSSLGGHNYWFQSKANINILLNQAKDVVSKDEMNTEIRDRVSQSIAFISNIKVLVDPTSDIPEQKQLSLIVLGPQYCNPIGSISKNVSNYIENTSTKKGNSDRIYRNTILYIAMSESGQAALYLKLKDLVSCKKVLSDFASTLERDQKQELFSKKQSYEVEVSKAIVSAYSVALRYSKQLGIQRHDMQSFAVDLSTQFSQNLLSELKNEEWLLDSVGMNILRRNNLLPTVDNPIMVSKLLDVFLRFDDKPMISSPQAIVETVNRYCQNGAFNVAFGTPSHFTRIYSNQPIPMLNPLDENYWLVDPSIVSTSDSSQSGDSQSSGESQGSTEGQQGTGEGENTPPSPTHVYKRIVIKGNVPMENWTQLFSSFIQTLKRNNLQIEIKFTAKTNSFNPLNDTSATIRSVKESASQLGLDFEVEE